MIAIEPCDIDCLCHATGVMFPAHYLYDFLLPPLGWHELHDPIISWAMDHDISHFHISGYVTNDHALVYFENLDDALLFSLRFS